MYNDLGWFSFQKFYVMTWQAPNFEQWGNSWLYESNTLLLLWQDIKVNDAISSYLQATLAILDKLDIETENPTEEEVARKFGWEDDYLADDLSLWQRVKPKIFSLFDEPHSSTCARVR